MISLPVSRRCLLGSVIHSLQFGVIQTIEKGAIIYDQNGVIERVLDLNDLQDPSVRNDLNDIPSENILDFSGKLILPGFVDSHCHAPQYVFAGTGMDMDLMEWLKTYTFPIESKFSDLDYAKYAYSRSVKRHLKNGTTFAAYYATIHKAAAVELTQIISTAGQRAFVGKVAMDRNSPDFYIESTKESISDTEDFVRQVLSQTEIGRLFLQRIDSLSSPSEMTPTSFLLRPTLLNQLNSPLVLPCITPRFVPTCTAESLSGLGALSHRYGLPVQSHLSESLNEIQFVRSLHPTSLTYGHIYHENSLLHRSSLLGHCIHCSESELSLLATTQTSAIHCPSSNFLLGSGIMDVKRFLAAGVRVGLGTDVAGGASSSMLDCIRNTITASRSIGFRQRGDGIPADFQQEDDAEDDHFESPATCPYQWLTTNEAFHLATLGGAEAVGMDQVFGNFLPGKKLDCLIVDVSDPAGPIDTFEGETVSNHFEKFIYLGDDRNIKYVIVDGKMVLGENNGVR